ncbi:hypothetical protein G6F16_013465 [Rhizopus arrhizus]|nr:hypothetical protein G6F20_012926 [Rhizopus arrhizus]KAG0845869.1 hypothetical protein G6F17_013463 [Rhizopus arrhizus]KAG0857821.1 hypothetical protein G6F16_013465 [Rhizopus arrhizus]KAG0889951.1 hypothetical protein G6F34_012781 [Rhizopus arrhizus]KAG1153283.1 hypothetical protein G6F36_014590 [Rhizopus arrhizus]
MNSELYQEILTTSLKDTMEYYALNWEASVFQHDNDPKHRSKSTTQWMKDSVMVCIDDWPSQSPDPNPIEHVTLVQFFDPLYMSQVVFPAIQDRTDLYTKRQKEKADSKNRQSTFPEGSYVMVRDREQYNSLSPVYKGPYRIVRQVQGGAYILRDVDETLMSRNYSPEELKIISQDEVRYLVLII